MKDKLLLAVLVASLAGCNSDSVKDALDLDSDDTQSEENLVSDNSGETSSGGSIESSSGEFGSVAGVYAWNSDEDGDEGYFVVGADGSFSEYDYAGDSYDNWANCYWSDQNITYLEQVSSDTWSLIMPNDFDGELRITTVNGGIKFYGTLFGEEGAEVYQKVNLQVSDFTPECD